MECQKITNSLQQTSDNKDLLKKRINKKRNYDNNNEIMTEKPIISISRNHSLLYKNGISKNFKFITDN